MPEATLEMGKDLDSAEGAQMLLIYLAIVVVLVSFFVHRFMQSQSQADNEDAKVLADKEEKEENKDNRKGKKKRGGMGRRGGNDVQEGLTPTLILSQSHATPIPSRDNRRTVRVRQAQNACVDLWSLPFECAYLTQWIKHGQFQLKLSSGFGAPPHDAPCRRCTMLPADVGAKHVLVQARFDAKRALQTCTCNHTNNHNNARCVCLTVCYYQVAAWQHWGPASAKGNGLFRSVSLRPSRSGLNASGGPRFRPLALCRCAIILGCE